MSALGNVRRADKAMSEAETRALLERGCVGRLATADAAGQPYVTPLLYVLAGGDIWLHNAATPGHLRANIEANPRACFEVDEPGPVFPYGRFACDTSIAYESAIAFGRIRVVDQRAAKEAFCRALMAKYAPDVVGRPAGFFPRLGQIAVYALALERLSGKRTPLPALGEQWPALDRSATPDAKPPR
ncbi:MAG TPA: pyridoxamine 5'-phosphate oxidase family protein [Caulobacteraceae bacterium]|nr:pyridoxamine 5'-phosphate oxidase family protein [Caulobacteraceae bacterium]